MVINLGLCPTTPNLRFELRVFSHACQVFNETLEETFVHIFA